MSNFRLLVLIALVGAVLLAIAWRTTDVIGPLDSSQIVMWFAGFGAMAPLAFFLGRTLGAVAFVPGSIMGISAGILFGPYWGVFYNLLASTAGAVLAFSIARFVAADWVARKVVDKKHLARLISGVEAEGWRFVAFVRLVPLFPYNVLNYALGLTRIKLSHYTLASLVCMIPADIAYVYIGYAGREAVAGNEAAIWMGLLALGLLACLAFIPRFVRAYRAQRETP